MGSLTSYALAGVIAIAASSSARAADLLPQRMPPPPVEVGGGWYLRGDVGVSAYNRGHFSSPDQPPAVFFNEDFGSGAFAGAGIGYQFNSWFRADVTGEFRFSTGVRATDRIDFDAGAGLRGVTNEFTTGNYHAGVVLVNGYFDLGTWYGLTPFIGAGIGVAHNRLNGFTDSSVTEIPIGGVASPSGGVFSDGTKTDLAWALHAGLAYDVFSNFKVELAYRYLNLGDAKTGILNCFCNQSFSPLRARDLESHDIKLGMRWMLAGPVLASAPMPGPIVRKY